MDSADSRVIAANTLALCVEKNQALAYLLARNKKGDKGLVQALCYGTARHYYLLEKRLDKLLERPLTKRAMSLKMLLLMGLHELDEGRRAAHTITNMFVDAARIMGGQGASGLCNAVLRRYLREAEEDAAADKPDDADYYPLWLVETLQREWPEQCESILTAGNLHPPLHLRVHTSKVSRADLQTRFASAGHESQILEHSETALLVIEPVSPQKLPGFDEGLFSVQDVCAQLASPMLKAESGMRVLDACSAPGGKLCHLLEEVPGIEAVALDISRTRMLHIRSNLKRLNLNAQLVCADVCKPKTWGQPRNPRGGDRYQDRDQDRGRGGDRDRDRDQDRGRGRDRDRDQDRDQDRGRGRDRDRDQDRDQDRGRGKNWHHDYEQESDQSEQSVAKIYQRIMLDAPCTGSGIIRRQGDIRLLLEQHQIDATARLQLKMLKSLWPLLEPGGLLLYSVCSIFRTEGDRVIEKFLDVAPLARRVRISTIPGALRLDHGIQLLPGGPHGGDGFYYSLLRKSAPGSL